MLAALPNAYGDAATNMAIDATLLESLPEGLAVFRHYGWTEPAATFGYAQSHAGMMAIAGSDMTLCRRLTGGGFVDHRNDWTYALVIHTALPCAQEPAAELYKTIHRALGQALDTLSIANRPAPCPRLCGETSVPSQLPAQCFVSPAADDVLRSDGRKIAGAAMKRNRHGLLIQGSLDRSALPIDFDFAKFQGILIERLADALKLPIRELDDLRPLFRSDRIEEAKVRFSSDAWNRRR